MSSPLDFFMGFVSGDRPWENEDGSLSGDSFGLGGVKWDRENGKISFGDYSLDYDGEKPATLPGTPSVKHGFLWVWFAPMNAKGQFRWKSLVGWGAVAALGYFALRMFR